MRSGKTFYPYTTLLKFLSLVRLKSNIHYLFSQRQGVKYELSLAIYRKLTISVRQCKSNNSDNSSLDPLSVHQGKLFTLIKYPNCYIMLQHNWIFIGIINIVRHNTNLTLPSFESTSTSTFLTSVTFSFFVILTELKKFFFLREKYRTTSLLGLFYFLQQSKLLSSVSGTILVQNFVCFVFLFLWELILSDGLRLQLHN